MTRAIKWLAVALCALVLLCGGGLWFASDQLLFPSWRGVSHDLSVCPAEAEAHWGTDCGNLHSTHQYKFAEASIASLNGYALPGWLIGSADNGHGPAGGAVLLVPAGGSDRREVSKYIPFFLGRGLDVLTVDLGCQGEAPCPVPGLSYGERESRDVLAAYLYLAQRYPKVYAMGSSVGAAAILIALPEMPKLTAAVVENPMTSFQELIREAPQSRSNPAWTTGLLLQTAMLRGRFDGLASAEHSLPLAGTTPVYFIHSKEDALVSYRQTQQLAQLYPGPKTVWLAERGAHASIWDVDHADYERRLGAFFDSLP